MTASRRRFARLILVVAFIGVPLVEIWVLIQVGQVIGAWWTILLLVLDSILGAWLIKTRGWQGRGGADHRPEHRSDAGS